MIIGVVLPLGWNAPD